MKVRVSALGALKEYLPEEQEILLDADEASLGEFISSKVGIPSNEPRICYIVNGRIQKATYQPCADDKIVVLKMAGAG